MRVLAPATSDSESNETDSSDESDDNKITVPKPQRSHSATAATVRTVNNKVSNLSSFRSNNIGHNSSQVFHDPPQPTPFPPVSEQIKFDFFFLSSIENAKEPLQYFRKNVYHVDDIKDSEDTVQACSQVDCSSSREIIVKNGGNGYEYKNCQSDIQEQIENTENLEPVNIDSCEVGTTLPAASDINLEQYQSIEPNCDVKNCTNEVNAEPIHSLEKNIVQNIQGEDATTLECGSQDQTKIDAVTKCRKPTPQQKNIQEESSLKIGQDKCSLRIEEQESILKNELDGSSLNIDQEESSSAGARSEHSGPRQCLQRQSGTSRSSSTRPRVYGAIGSILQRLRQGKGVHPPNPNVQSFVENGDKQCFTKEYFHSTPVNDNGYKETENDIIGLPVRQVQKEGVHKSNNEYRKSLWDVSHYDNINNRDSQAPKSSGKKVNHFNSKTKADQVLTEDYSTRIDEQPYDTYQYDEGFVKSKKQVGNVSEIFSQTQPLYNDESIIDRSNNSRCHQHITKGDTTISEYSNNRRSFSNGISNHKILESMKACSTPKAINDSCVDNGPLESRLKRGCRIRKRRKKTTDNDRVEHGIETDPLELRTENNE